MKIEEEIKKDLEKIGEMEQRAANIHCGRCLVGSCAIRNEQSAKVRLECEHFILKAGFVNNLE